MTNTFSIAGSSDFVHEYTEHVESGTFGQPTTWEEGLRYFERDSDGAKLNRISESQYQVVTTGEIITVSI